MVREVAGTTLNRPVPNFTHTTGPVNKPKRPISSYIRYANSVREEVKEKYNLTNAGQIASKIGQMWKELPEEDKKPFIEEYESEIADLNQQFKDFVISKPQSTINWSSSVQTPPRTVTDTQLDTKSVRGKRPKKSAV